MISAQSIIRVIRSSNDHREGLRAEHQPVFSQVTGPTKEPEQHCPLWAHQQSAASFHRPDRGI